jgi:hypothetical protein
MGCIAASVARLGRGGSGRHYCSAYGVAYDQMRHEFNPDTYKNKHFYKAFTTLSNNSARHATKMHHVAGRPAQSASLQGRRPIFIFVTRISPRVSLFHTLFVDWTMTPRPPTRALGATTPPWTTTLDDIAVHFPGAACGNRAESNVQRCWGPSPLHTSTRLETRQGRRMVLARITG